MNYKYLSILLLPIFIIIGCDDDTSTTAAVFAAAASYTDAYVFLRNKSASASEIIHIRSGATDSADIMSLGAEEFAFFPWSSDEDLVYDA